MTRKDVKKVVDALKKRDFAVIDMDIPVIKYFDKVTSKREISLNIMNPPFVVSCVCEDLDID